METPATSAATKLSREASANLSTAGSHARISCSSAFSPSRSHRRACADGGGRVYECSSHQRSGRRIVFSLAARQPFRPRLAAAVNRLLADCPALRCWVNRSRLVPFTLAMLGVCARSAVVNHHRLGGCNVTSLLQREARLKSRRLKVSFQPGNRRMRARQWNWSRRRAKSKRENRSFFDATASNRNGGKPARRRRARGQPWVFESAMSLHSTGLRSDAWQIIWGITPI